MSTTEGQNATQMPPAVTEKELIPANHYPATTEKAVTPYQSSLTSNVQAATPYYHSTSQSTVTPNSTTSKSITTTKTVAKPIYIVTCQCSSGAFANMTSTQIVHELVANTTIDVRKTSSKQRRYYSANDSRPSSQNVGCVGICILVVISGMIVVPDLISLIKHLCGKT